jgi:hypothetical protein
VEHLRKQVKAVLLIQAAAAVEKVDTIIQVHIQAATAVQVQSLFGI